MFRGLLHGAHGSAPDIAGQNLAKVLALGELVPRDLGGSASCSAMTEAICRALR